MKKTSIVAIAISGVASLFGAFLIGRIYEKRKTKNGTEKDGTLVLDKENGLYLVLDKDIANNKRTVTFSVVRSGNGGHVKWRITMK